MGAHRSDRNRDGVGRARPRRQGSRRPRGNVASYTGQTSHPRCVQTFAETQRDQIAALQEKVQAQRETVNLLKNQLDRQASTSADLQRQLAQPPAVVQAVPPLYAYPPVGFGLYLGRPWIYGPPYYFTARTSTAHTTMDHATVGHRW